MPSHKSKGVSRRVRQTILVPYPRTPLSHSTSIDIAPVTRNLGQKAVAAEREKALQRGQLNTQGTQTHPFLCGPCFQFHKNKGLSDQAQQALAELSGNIYDEPDLDHDSSVLDDHDLDTLAQNEPILCAIRDIASQEQ